MYYSSRHGGDLVEAQRISGFSKEELIDLSTNINPIGAPREIFEYLSAHPRDIHRYPDLEYRELYKNLEHFSAMPHENIIAGNGASEIINLLINALKPKKILIVHPTYGEYERECLKLNATIDYYVPDDIIPDMEELKKRIPKYNLVFICNPNNPSGNLLPKISLLELLPKTHKTWLFIDESFMDFVVEDRYSLKSFVTKAKIFILHSLTKIFAIPGLRIGCGYGPADLIAEMRQLQIPWSINTLAAKSTSLALNNNQYIEETREIVKDIRTYSYSLLNNIDKIKTYPSSVNFLLLDISKTGFTSSQLQLKLLEKKYLVRNGNTFPGLKEDFIRIALKHKDIMHKFIETLNEIIYKGDNHD